MYRRFKLIEPAVAIASLVVGSTALSSVAWCGKEPPPSTSDLFSARSRSRTDVESTRWLKLQTISYRDQTGRDRLWDVCSRTTRDASAVKSDVDGVAIVALLRRSSDPSAAVEMLIVQQFRPPVDKVTVELPAGLVDAGESAEEAALRELQEETGYVGSISSCSQSIGTSPGLTDEAFKLVVVDVDLDAPANRQPQQALSDTEFIKVRRVPLHRLHVELKMLEQAGCLNTEGLYFLGLGLMLGLNMAVASTKPSS